MTTREARNRAHSKYRREKCRTVQVTLFPTDRDIIEKLDSVDNKSGYIKGLIRADVEGGR